MQPLLLPLVTVHCSPLAQLHGHDYLERLQVEGPTALQEPLVRQAVAPLRRAVRSPYDHQGFRLELRLEERGEGDVISAPKVEQRRPGMAGAPRLEPGEVGLREVGELSQAL
jgi:hypothetical protein